MKVFGISENALLGIGLLLVFIASGLVEFDPLVAIGVATPALGILLLGLRAKP